MNQWSRAIYWPVALTVVTFLVFLPVPRGISPVIGQKVLVIALMAWAGGRVVRLASSPLLGAIGAAALVAAVQLIVCVGSWDLLRHRFGQPEGFNYALEIEGILA